MSIFKRDQLIIYASKQAKVDLLSIEINNNNSKFHSWPVTKNNNIIEFIKKNY